MLIILGKGFEQILLPTLIVATLNGHSLETDIIEPNSNPEYDHDLVWEVDKNRLRKYVSYMMFITKYFVMFVIKTIFNFIG